MDDNITDIYWSYLLNFIYSYNVKLGMGEGIHNHQSRIIFWAWNSGTKGGWGDGLISIIPPFWWFYLHIIPYYTIPPFLGFKQPDCRFKEYNVWKFTTDGDFTSNVGDVSLPCRITRGLTPQTHWHIDIQNMGTS